MVEWLQYDNIQPFLMIQVNDEYGMYVFSYLFILSRELRVIQNKYQILFVVVYLVFKLLLNG